MGDSSSVHRGRAAFGFRGPVAPAGARTADASGPAPVPAHRLNRSSPVLEHTAEDLLEAVRDVPRGRPPRRGFRPQKALGLRLMRSRCVEEGELQRLLSWRPDDLYWQIGTGLFTPEQARRILERHPMTHEKPGLSRLEVFERLLLRCPATREERATLLDCFAREPRAVREEAQRLLDDAPPPNTLAPLTTAAYQKHYTHLIGHRSGAVGAEDVVWHLAGRLASDERVELSAIEIREALVSVPREERLEVLRTAWGLWTGKQPEILWKAIPPEDQEAARELVASAPTPEERAELHAYSHVDVLESLLQGWDSLPKSDRLALEVGRCTAAQLRQLLLMSPDESSRRRVFDDLCLSWDGQGRKHLIVDAFRDPLHRAEVARTLDSLPSPRAHELGESDFLEIRKGLLLGRQSPSPRTFTDVLAGRSLTALQCRALLALHDESKRVNLADLLVLHLREGEALDDLLVLLPDAAARARLRRLHDALSQADARELDAPDFARFWTTFRELPTVTDRARILQPPDSVRERLRRLTRPALPETLTSLQAVKLLAWGHSEEAQTTEAVLLRWQPDVNTALLRTYAEKNPTAASLIDTRYSTAR